MYEIFRDMFSIYKRNYLRFLIVLWLIKNIFYFLIKIVFKGFICFKIILLMRFLKKYVLFFKCLVLLYFLSVIY